MAVVRERGVLGPVSDASPSRNKFLSLHAQPDDDRPDRMCVTVSDLHFTDGSVGFQNLPTAVWETFYGDIVGRCKRYGIKELTVILDGDVVDLIRTDKWARKNFYPWQQEENQGLYKEILKNILTDIVEVRHRDFFEWFQKLPANLMADTDVADVHTVVLLGNHDKELLNDNEVLGYFYEKALGRHLDSISEQERRWLGRMYGDEDRFLDKSIAPFLPFYYGDQGFRYFVTHGQWRDAANNRRIASHNGMPGWKNSQGWTPEIWQKLGFAPFTESCFGDTVTAGLLSTFLYKTKKVLAEHQYNNQTIFSILDEMDLYRPTYRAAARLLELTRAMRKKREDVEIMRLIEDTMFESVMMWLKWPQTLAMSSGYFSIVLRLLKYFLLFLKFTHTRLEIPILIGVFKHFSAPFRWFGLGSDAIAFKTLKSLPAFLPEYQHYGFQLHGEGHTHIPYEADVNLESKYLPTYVNFGTWRDQIINRRESGYRRRSVLRAFFILDLIDKTPGNSGQRSFDYHTQDYILWSDKLDDLERGDKEKVEGIKL